MLWCESPLEADFLNLLEFDPEVLSIETQPLKVEYHVDGERHTYTPDVRVYRPLTKQIVEVKEDLEAESPDNQKLYRIVGPILESEGYQFLVAKQSMIRLQPRLSNVKLLLRYSRTSFGLRERLACREFFSARQSAPLRDLVDFCAHRNITADAVHSLLCHGVLIAELNRRLDYNSIVCPAGRVPSLRT